MSSCISIVCGRLTRDPEAGEENKPTKFGIAYETGFGDKKKSHFLDCVAWGKTGEFISNFFVKGKPIYLVGEIHMNQWDDRETGKRRTKHELSVRDAKFLDKDSSNTEQQEEVFS